MGSQGSHMSIEGNRMKDFSDSEDDEGTLKGLKNKRKREEDETGLSISLMENTENTTRNESTCNNSAWSVNPERPRSSLEFDASMWSDKHYVSLALDEVADDSIDEETWGDSILLRKALGRASGPLMTSTPLPHKRARFSSSNSSDSSFLQPPEIDDQNVGDQMEMDDQESNEIAILGQENTEKEIEILKQENTKEEIELIEILDQEEEQDEIEIIEQDKIKFPEQEEMEVPEQDEIEILEQDKIKFPEQEEMEVPEQDEIEVQEQEESQEEIEILEQDKIIKFPEQEEMEVPKQDEIKFPEQEESKDEIKILEQEENVSSLDILKAAYPNVLDEILQSFLDLGISMSYLIPQSKGSNSGNFVSKQERDQQGLVVTFHGGASLHKATPEEIELLS